MPFRLKIIFISCLFCVLPLSQASSQNLEEQTTLLFQAGQNDQKSLKWQDSLAKFKQIIATSPQSVHAQKAHIEIGKFYKYQRDWQKAIDEYHQSIAISPHSRPAHDAKTAEAAVYYFRQDFPRALEIFREVLAETKDWDQIKYCSYWIKELRRKMSFAPEDSFACGPESLKIALRLLKIDASEGDNSSLFTYREGNSVSISDLAKVAAGKGLHPKVVKVARSDIQNLDTPFIALVEPEHYVVVTSAGEGRVQFIDPANRADTQNFTLEEFSRQFSGYALIFLDEKKFAKINYAVPSESELKGLKGGVCYCCPPSALGGSGTNPNVEFDGSSPGCPGMPSWMVNTVNLNFIIQDIDFRYTSRGMPVEFVRTYNADDPREGVFGRSWTFNYNISLVENPDKSIDVRRGDGRVDHFFWNGTRYQGPEGVYDTLTKNADATYVLTIKKNKTTQNFSAQGRLTNIKDRNNNTITFSYDAQGKLIQITDPNGKNITLSYGPNNKASRITLPDSRYVSFTYDANNNLIQSTDTKGATTAYAYDSASYITAITTPHQGKTDIVFQSSGDGYAIESITDALGGVRRYDTLESHYRIRVRDSLNHATLYNNNSDGYTESITTPSGNKITFEYDSLANRTKIKDTEGNTTALTYDGRGNIISVTDSLNNKLTLAYDASDNLTSTTDPKGNIYNFTYDARSNLTQARDPDNQVTTFSYNTYGQLKKLTDAKGAVTGFTYDTAGNLIKMTDPLGKITAYAYDALGRLTSLTDPKGNTFSYAYDGVDHLTKITYPDATTATYTYNCCNLLQARDKLGTLKFTYDAIGRMASFVNYDNKQISYAYDTEDNLITLTYSDNKKVNYEYDADNRLIKVTDWLSNITRYNYDRRGNLSFSTSPGLITIYKYDVAGRMTKLINYNSATMAITSGFEFSLDNLGNRSQIKRYLPLNMPNFNLTDSNYSYNNDNQLISATGKTFTYDDNGNFIKQVAGSVTANFTYNYDNQLTNYVSGSTNLSYLYDALGNRIQKTQGTTTTKFILDPNRALASVLAETNSSGAITVYYVYGLGLISKIEGSNAYFYQYDGLGSTVALTDSTGAVKNKYAYDDFGNLATNSSETIANPFKYVGRFGVMTDTDDLLYMRARYYSPSIGRFINKDPIGLASGLNLYGYVGGNPISWIDPSGLSWRDIDPNYGNWGGNNWGGGGYVRNGRLGNMGVSGIDSMDDLFKRHDYESCMGNPLADRNLARGLRQLPLDPRRWSRPAPNVWKARYYRWLVEQVFR